MTVMTVMRSRDSRKKTITLDWAQNLHISFANRSFGKMAMAQEPRAHPYHARDGSSNSKGVQQLHRTAGMLSALAFALNHGALSTTQQQRVRL